MGATNCSSSSGLNVVPLLWALRRKGHGHTMSTARSQTKGCLGICFIGLPFHLLDNRVDSAQVFRLCRGQYPISLLAPCARHRPCRRYLRYELLYSELDVAHYCYPSVP